MSAAAPAAVLPRVMYRRRAECRTLSPGILAAISFGAGDPLFADPRCVDIGLRQLNDEDMIELWISHGAVRFGTAGPLRYAMDDDFLFGIVEIDERRYDGIAAAAGAAYRAIVDFQRESSHAHVLRMWNYFDRINDGDADAERYKQFCLGRASGLADSAIGALPAATGIGRLNGSPILQVYWLAGRVPGIALENPRQTSAFRYPRQYGPAAPSFSRAMVVSNSGVVISGTASIVGFQSRHAGDLAAQLQETTTNLKAVLAAAAQTAPGVPPEFDGNSLFKLYLRDAALRDDCVALLRQQLPEAAPLLTLEADICRRDLLLEIECIHAAAAGAA